MPKALAVGAAGAADASDAEDETTALRPETLAAALRVMGDKVVAEQEVFVKGASSPLRHLLQQRARSLSQLWVWCVRACQRAVLCGLFLKAVHQRSLTLPCPTVSSFALLGTSSHCNPLPTT